MVDVCLDMINMVLFLNYVHGLDKLYLIEQNYKIILDLVLLYI
jgi:hypothetical protein